MEDVFSYHTSSGNIGFWYSKGNSVMRGKEFHTYHEILYIHRARGVLYTETRRFKLTPDMLILIPKETFHSFVFENEREYTRCRIALPESERFSELCQACMEGVQVFFVPSDGICALFSEMTGAFSADFDKFYSESDRVLLLESVLIRLLLALKREKPCPDPEKEDSDRALIAAALAFIGENYTKDINVESVASALYVSRSKLSHSFAAKLGISVHRYILDKRLLQAHLMIKNGSTPGEACAATGFGDYSSFYRHYRNRYGHMPSEKADKL